MSRKFTVAKTNKMIQEDALLLDMQTCEVINRVSSTVDLESLSVLSDLEKKFLWHPGYESSNFPQNLTNARVLFSTSIDHCLDHFESLELAQAQLREKSHLRHYSLANQRFLRSVRWMSNINDVCCKLA